MKLKWFLLVLILWGGSVSAEDGFAPAPESVNPLLVGQQMPPLILTADNGEAFDLNAQNKKKPLVIVFYRGHW